LAGIGDAEALAVARGLVARGDEELEHGLADALDLGRIDFDDIVEVGGEDEADAQVFRSDGGAVRRQTQRATARTKP